MRAVIMCGGQGSRLRPLTECTPKPLIKLINKPIIDIIIEKLISGGIKDISISLGYLADDIIDHCNKLNVDAELKFFTENKPLGTAGGVKNCLTDCIDDTLILSGDNIFDINLEEFIRYFHDNDCDVAICGVSVDDPREYGTILCSDNGMITGFVEKPTWEQTESNLINTGIYIVNSKVIEMIPKDEYCDFATDIFPCLLENNNRFYCYKSDGFWGDIGEFDAYKRITDYILDGKFAIKNSEGKLITRDIIIDDDSIIKAPCFISNDVKIGNGCVIGPYCVIDSDTVIDKNVVLSGCIIGSDVYIAENTQICDSFLSDSVSIKDNCIIEEKCVLGFGVILGRFVRVLSGKKLSAGVRVNNEALVASDVNIAATGFEDYDSIGVSYQGIREFTVNDALDLGKAIAGVSEIKRIGIASDGSSIGEIYKNCVSSGISVCGAECFDYGHIFKNQAHFFSAYSSLDFFVFVNSQGEKINFSFFGRQGLPVSVKTVKKIINNLKFSVYKYAAADKCTEIIPADYFSTVYVSLLKKLAGENTRALKINIESENRIIKECAEKAFAEFTKSVSDNNNCSLYLLYNNSASEMYVVCGDKTYSGDRIISSISELEIANGNDILIPEEFPSFIEDYESELSGKVHRITGSNRDSFCFSDREVIKSLWAFDCLVLTAKLIGYLQSLGCSIEELFANQSFFEMRKSIVTVDRKASEIGNILKNIAVKPKNDIYYIFENRQGRVRIRQLGNTAKIRILAESYDMESAKEISGFVIKKINECNIDNSQEKL